jgi:hypothetical protein
MMKSRTDVLRLLNSVGKEVFVRYFDTFADRTLSNDEVIALLPPEYSLRSRRSRTSTARRILREGLTGEALGIILSSERLDPEIIRAARSRMATQAPLDRLSGR